MAAALRRGWKYGMIDQWLALRCALILEALVGSWKGLFAETADADCWTR